MASNLYSSGRASATKQWSALNDNGRLDYIITPAYGIVTMEFVAKELIILSYLNFFRNTFRVDFQQRLCSLSSVSISSRFDKSF